MTETDCRRSSTKLFSRCARNLAQYDVILHRWAFVGLRAHFGVRRHLAPRALRRLALVLLERTSFPSLFSVPSALTTTKLEAVVSHGVCFAASSLLSSVQTVSFYNSE